MNLNTVKGKIISFFRHKVKKIKLIRTSNSVLLDILRNILKDNKLKHFIHIHTHTHTHKASR